MRESEKTTAIGQSCAATPGSVCQDRPALGEQPGSQRPTRDVNATGHGVVGIDADGLIDFVNPAAIRQLGYGPEELLGRPVHAALLPVYPDGSPYPEDRSFLLDALRRGRHDQSASEQFRRKDGSGLPVDCSVTPVRDRNGGVVGAIIAFVDISADPVGEQHACAVARDMTEQRQTQEALRRSEERFRHVLEHAPVVVGCFGQDQRNTWMFGRQAIFDPADLLGKRFDEVPAIANGAEAAEAVRQTLQTGQGRRLEIRVVAPVGGERTYDLSLQPLKNEQGMVTEVACVAVDISQRVQAESALRDSERRFRSAFDDSGVAMSLSATDGTLLRANRATCALTGRTEAELRQCTIQDLTHDDDRQRECESISRLLAGGRTERLRKRILLKDGREVPVEVTRTLVRDDVGTPLYFIGQTQDLSRQTQLEAKLGQASRLESAGRFAGGIAHDFNNMLTAIRGNAQLLALPGTEAGRRVDIDAILLAADRAAALTAQLLAFGRRQFLRPRHTDVNQLVHDTLPLVRHTEPISGIQLVLAPDVGAVLVDPGQLQQALVNLVLNSRDALRDGQQAGAKGLIRIVSATAILDADAVTNSGVKPGRYVRLTVQDDGAGMDATTQAHVFEPFYTTKRPGQGSGLGLAMVYGFVKQSAGHVEVESAPGRGTAMHLYLPEAPLPAQQLLSLSKAPAPRPVTGSGTVLVVDDDASVLGVVRRLLLAAGFQVIAVGSGAEAIDWLEGEAPFDALLTDVVMPVVDGRQVIAAAQRLRPSLPVAAMSGYTSDEDTRRLLGMRGVALLSKPFGSDELQRFMTQLVGSREVSA